MFRTLTSLLTLTLFPTLTLAATVTATRCPDGGVQPQAALDTAGKVHLVYLKYEDSGAADVFYCTSNDAGKSWSKPLRVNSHPNSAIATGTVRGAHLSLGRNNRPHVAWMGSHVAEPRGPKGSTPMLYTRLNDAGDAFEPQRNLITSAPGLDGGGSVAADPNSDTVAVTWHAPLPGTSGEGNRTVLCALSPDGGKTFRREVVATHRPLGACGCCGMRSIFTQDGFLLSVYRSVDLNSRAIRVSHYALSPGSQIANRMIEDWPTKTCPMSTAALTRVDRTVFIAWETAGQVRFATTPAGSFDFSKPTAAPGKGNNRKHPALAATNANQTLLAWTEGTAWKKGGSVHWQHFDAAGKPASDPGARDDLPAWSLPTAVPTPDGNFLVLY